MRNVYHFRLTFMLVLVSVFSFPIQLYCNSEIQAKIETHWSFANCVSFEYYTAQKNAVNLTNQKVAMQPDTQGASLYPKLFKEFYEFDVQLQTCRLFISPIECKLNNKVIIAEVFLTKEKLIQTPTKASAVRVLSFESFGIQPANSNILRFFNTPNYLVAANRCYLHFTEVIMWSAPELVLIQQQTQFNY